MGFGVENIVAASMSMKAAQLQQDYSYALLKKTMDSAADQALSLINDLAAAVPAPSQYNFDVWA